MPRVEMLERENLPDWAKAKYNPEDDQTLRVFARTPDVHEAWVGFARVALKSSGLIGSRLKELIRLKSANINHCTR